MSTATAPLDFKGPWQQIAKDHPALPGHFPGRPVVPGVVLLDRLRLALLEALPDATESVRITALPAVKFLRPVLPEQAFRICLQGEPPALRFQIEADDGQVSAQGQLRIEQDPVAA